MSDGEILKPCPFCGSVGKHEHHYIPRDNFHRAKYDESYTCCDCRRAFHLRSRPAPAPVQTDGDPIVRDSIYYEAHQELDAYNKGHADGLAAARALYATVQTEGDPVEQVEALITNGPLVPLAWIDLTRSLARQLREAQALLERAREYLIWCGGSADFGPGGQAKIGYDKGPRATIAAIDAATLPATNAVPQASADPAGLSQPTTETDAERIRKAFPHGVKERGRGDEPAGAAPSTKAEEGK